MLLRRTLMAGAAAAVLALPAAASADSIVYIQGGDVWSMRPDGSGKIQITTGGNWHSPTQADDGRIAAVQGTGPIKVMAPDGRPLHEIVTSGAPSSNGGTFGAAPVSLAFTPDGSRIAYSYIQSPCPVAPWSCNTTSQSTFYTDNQPGAATPQSVWGNQFGVSDPEWITNDRALVFGGSGAQVSLDDLGGGDYSYKTWMKPSADMGDGELSRDMKRLATTFFYGPETVLAMFAVKGDPRTPGAVPPQPDVICSSGKDENLADPSWSPDANGLAFQASSGIEVFHFTGGYTAPDCGGGVTSVEIAPGGRSPDWGPADPPAVAWRPPGQQQPPPGQQPPATTPPATTKPTTTTTTPQPRGGTKTQGKSCKVPKLSRGTALKTAQRKLKAAGCTVKVKRARAKGVRKGRLVKVSAKAGSRATTVTITVAR